MNVAGWQIRTNAMDSASSWPTSSKFASSWELWLANSSESCPSSSCIPRFISLPFASHWTCWLIVDFISPIREFCRKWTASTTKRSEPIQSTMPVSMTSINSIRSNWTIKRSSVTSRVYSAIKPRLTYPSNIKTYLPTYQQIYVIFLFIIPALFGYSRS